jgi:hypothetical protein
MEFSALVANALGVFMLAWFAFPLAAQRARRRRSRVVNQKNHV